MGSASDWCGSVPSSGHSPSVRLSYVPTSNPRLNFPTCAISFGSMEPTRVVSRRRSAREECAEYAREALESRAWDAAATDLARLIAAFESLAEGQGTSRRIRVAAPAHRLTCRLIQSVMRLFRLEALPHAAWRRLDVALWALGRTRRGLDRRSLDLLEVYAAPSALRPYLVRSLGSAHREVRRDAARLLSEVEEAAEYAFAALDAGIWEAARIDLERLDAGYRGLRWISQRESMTYFPEPWLVRRLARRLTGARMKREAAARRRIEFDRAMESLGKRGLLDEPSGILR